MARQLNKPTEKALKILVQGYRHDGKTELVANWLKPGEVGYIVPIDNREDEYWERKPDSIWQGPEVDVAKGEHRESDAIDRAIAKDAKSGFFSKNKVGVVAFDSITPIYDQHARQKDNAGKSNAMAHLFGAGNRVPCDALYLIHLRMAGEGQTGQTMKQRESLSQLEVARSGMYIDTIIELVREKRHPKTGIGSGKFGVKIVWYRNRPDWQGVTIWDDVGNYVGMRDKIKAAISGVEAETEKASFTDFGESKPFPNPNAAITMGAEYHIVYKKEKFFPFGDPSASVAKKNGETGVNGAMNYARNAYDAIREGKKAGEGYPKPTSAGHMAKMWVDYVTKKTEALTIEEPEQPAQESFADAPPETYYSEGQ